MTREDSDGSLLAAAAGGTTPGVLETFELLADETRLATLLALWEGYEFTGDDAIPFSELRERVGNPDSGQFNYHLGKLTGELVRSTDEGYQLQPGAEKIIRAVIASGVETPTLEQTELGMPCPRCAGPTVVRYQDGHLFQVCTDCAGYFEEKAEFPRGTLYRWRLDPAGLADRSPTEAYTAASVGMLQRTLAMIEGVCPACSGPVEAELAFCDDHEAGPEEVCSACGREDEIDVLYRCSVCEFRTCGPPSAFVSQHPAVIAFYYDHGVEFQYQLGFEGVQRVLELGEAHEQSIASRDPLRIRVTVRYEGDELRLLLDEHLSVLEVEE